MELFAFDDEYVRRLRAGDRWTKEHFADYFGKLLLIKLRGRVSPQDVEELRQDVLARVLQKLDTLRDGRKLGSFVNSFCNNVLHEYQADSPSRRDESLDEARHDVADPCDLETAFVTAEKKERVRRVLNSLPPRDADVLRTLFIDETDKDALCARFGVDRSYLRVLLHRAKEKFREEYQRAEAAEIRPGDETNRPPGSLHSQERRG